MEENFVEDFPFHEWNGCDTHPSYWFHSPRGETRPCPRHCSIVSNPWTQFNDNFDTLPVPLDGETFLERVHPGTVCKERRGGSWNAKDCRCRLDHQNREFIGLNGEWGDGKALKDRWILGGLREWKRRRKVYSLSRILREGWNIALVKDGGEI